MDDYHEIVKFQERRFSFAEMTYLNWPGGHISREKIQGNFSHLALDRLCKRPTMRIKWYKIGLNVKPLLQIIVHIKLFFRLSLIHLII